MRKFVGILLGTASICVASAAISSETITYTYDAHGRLQQVARSGSVNNGVSSRYYYDPSDNRASYWSGTGSPPSAPAEPPPAFIINDAALGEGNVLTFTVSRHGSINSTFSVNYATAGGTATSGTDFTATSGTLYFGPDDYIRTVTVQTTQDSQAESDETFTVNLSGQSGGATLSDGQGLGTIVNDDSSNQPPVTNTDYSSTALCGEGVSVNVVANDTDPDGNYPLSLVSIVSATKGYASVQSSTNVFFTPTLSGTAVVTYRIQDTVGAQVNGTLYINVTGQGPCQ